MPTQPSKQLETFDNPNPERDYTIEISMPEFTCLCPKTGQPDFATLYLDYIPDRKCVELKSLKLYIWAYRNEGAFHEAVTNQILGDLVAATAPRYMRLRAEFYVRGGVFTTVTAEHRKPGFASPPPAPRTDARDTLHAELVGHETPVATHTPPSGRNRADNGSTASRFRMLARARQPEGNMEAQAPAAKPRAPTRSAAVPPPTAPAPAPRKPVYVGIDLGTSSCRVVAIDEKGELLAQAGAPIPLPVKTESQITQDPQLWWKAVSASLTQLFKEIGADRVAAVAVDGTSGTLLLTDTKGVPLTPALMYNDARAVAEADSLLELADPKSGAHGASSSLAKLLWLKNKGLDRKAAHALHQADWIAGMLTGRFGHSDYNNCLKLGYDAEALNWPDWLGTLGINRSLLPEVHKPGDDIGTVSADLAKAFGLRADTRVLAGTTDGVAAFLAAGASRPGHGVTALGSTLVLKLLSDKPVFAAEHGVYSHRLLNRWLVGGASNSGGAVLLQYFKLEQLREMTPQLDATHLTGLEYYPLPGIGERFPINDPGMQPILEPLPGDSITFFQGMLEGIAGIEAHGYQLLRKLGAPKVSEIRTTGGGAQNPAWTKIRERIIGVPLKPAHSELSAFGAALLAANLVAKRIH
jgi:7-cyano-7-deazaguanine reductase